MAFSKFLIKIRNKHFLSLAGNGSMAVLSVLTYAVLYRFLPGADMGNWVFYQFAFVLLDSFRTGFLQTALIKFYSGSTSERQKNVAGSTWYIALLITCVFALPNLPALYFINSVQDSGIRMFVQWYGLNLFFTLPFNIAFWILQAEEEFGKILVLRLINQGSFILLLLIIFLLHKINIQNILYLFLISSLLTSVTAIFTGWSQLSSIIKKTSVCVTELFQFGKYSVGSYICSTLLKSSDSFIIKFMLGPAALAVYNLPQRLMEIIEIPMRSFISTALPAMSAAYNSNNADKVIYIMKKYTGILTLFFIPIIIGMVLLADVMVLLLGGHSYLGTEAANVFRIFMFFSILFPIERFPGITLDIIHKPQINLLKVLLSLLVNVVTDILAIKMFGSVYGVAAASIFTLLCGVIFGFVSLNKYVPFNLNGILKLGYSASLELVKRRSN